MYIRQRPLLALHSRFYQSLRFELLNVAVGQFTQPSPCEPFLQHAQGRQTIPLAALPADLAPFQKLRGAKVTIFVIIGEISKRHLRAFNGTFSMIFEFADEWKESVNSEELGGDYVERMQQEATARQFVQRLERLGYTVEAQANAAACCACSSLPRTNLVQKCCRIGTS